MKTMDSLISSIANKKLKSDPISGKKGRFQFNIQGIRDGVKELVYDLCLENAIDPSKPSEEELEYIKEEVERIYDEF